MQFLYILLVIAAASSGTSAFHLDLPELQNLINIEPRIFESTINASIECVRGVLSNGLPELGLPSLNPLLVGNLTLDLDALNIANISGKLSAGNAMVTDLPSFRITAIKGDFILVPPTFTVTFAVHYDKCASSGYYKANVTLFGKNIWGEGYMSSEVQDLTASGYIKAVVQQDGVHVEEFKAPITLEKYNLTITGLENNETLSRTISEEVSGEAPGYINSHPEIFTDIIAPAMIKIFNDLVNNDVGLGIVKHIVQICIIDVVFPPTPAPPPQ